ncbi:MAG: helix-turn-helix domain-containing protein [Actinomycetota bacterium]
MDAHRRLDVLKALGDNTRYAIYLELARSASPLTTAHIAGTLDLHPNTVRPHLERMREVRLLDVSIDTRSGRGRPQHLYALAEDAPSLGLEPPVFPTLARMLLRLAETAGLDAEEAADAGREQGVIEANRSTESGDVEKVVDHLVKFGFDPEIVSDDPDDFTVCFTNCPFADLARANPDIVCSLHRGLLEGVVSDTSVQVVGFRSVADRRPCQADLTFA